MSVERWWSRPRPTPRPTPAVTDPCPICVHLHRRYGDAPILQVSHGAGGQRGHWRACYGHYKVISAFEWIGLTPRVIPEEMESA